MITGDSFGNSSTFGFFEGGSSTSSMGETWVRWRLTPRCLIGVFFAKRASIFCMTAFSLSRRREACLMILD